MVGLGGLRRSSVAAGGVVSTIGVLLAGLHLLHGVSEFPDEIVAIIYGVVFPFSVALMVIGSGIWIATHDWHTVSPWRIVGWTAGGVVGSVILIGLLILYQQAEGVAVSDPVFTMFMFATYGAGGGLIFGRYDSLEERRRIQLSRETERLNEFTGIVSHDLRNPLNVASGNLELAREEDDSRRLEKVAQAHQRMDAMIEHLLARAQMEETAAERELVQLNEIVHGSWRNVATGEAELVTDIEGSIRANESCLQQLFENLFRNAIDHGPTDVTVIVGRLDDGFFVEDDGPGIPTERRDEVFDSGYSTIKDGTGFGLAIVEQIVEAHGWTLQLTDGRDGGARFEITDIDSL